MEVGQRGSFGPMRQPEAGNTTMGVGAQTGGAYE